MMIKKNLEHFSTSCSSITDKTKCVSSKGCIYINNKCIEQPPLGCRQYLLQSQCESNKCIWDVSRKVCTISEQPGQERDFFSSM
jgi:hypothetical protein